MLLFDLLDLSLLQRNQLLETLLQLPAFRRKVTRKLGKKKKKKKKKSKTKKKKSKNLKTHHRFA
jgi:hypothetical protein